MTEPCIVSSPSPVTTAAAVARMLSLPPDAFELTAVAGDAGNRRYYRVQTSTGQRYIAAHDSSRRQLTTFVRLQQLFAAAGATVPALVARQQQVLLLEDFGDTTYLARLPASSAPLYRAALQTLQRIQRAPALRAALPPYSEALLQREMRLYQNWYCARHLHRPLGQAALKDLRKMRATIAATMLAQPAVAVHRDYHSRNLMVLNAARSPGVLDFQDAVAGCALYDVVSLLRDAYIEWPLPQQRRWLKEYWDAAARPVQAGMENSFERCEELFNLVTVQRGLKVLGIFCRLAWRDNKPGYLDDLPLVYRHVRQACAAVPALAPLMPLLTDYPPTAADRSCG